MEQLHVYIFELHVLPLPLTWGGGHSGTLLYTCVNLKKNNKKGVIFS